MPLKEGPNPYFPEQPRDPYNQRELIYVSSKVGLAAFEFFVRRDELKALNYPENFFEVKEFKALTQKEKHIERVRALHEIVGPLGFQIDDGIQALLTVDIKKDRNLRPEEKKEAVDFVNAVILTTNYYERLVSNGGNTQIFTATPETSRNGVVSTDDGARLNMKHLRVIVKNMPEVSDVIAILDREYSRQLDLSSSDTWKSRKPQEIIDEITKPAGMPDERFDSIKILARAWYDLLGMPDIRAQQHKDRLVREYFPEAPKDGDRYDYREFRREVFTRGSPSQVAYQKVTGYRGIPLEYNSVCAFVMDPAKLLGGVLKNYKGIIASIEMSAKYEDQTDKHNIFNLGWVPAGYELMEQIAYLKTKGTNHVVSNLTYEELANWNLATNPLGKLTNEQWDQIEEAVDWQKIMINNLEKADGAKVAFLKLFSGDAKEIANIYGSVMAYLRDQRRSKDDTNPFIREDILPMVSTAVCQVITSGIAQIDKNTMNRIVRSVNMQAYPVVAFTEKQIEEMVDASFDSSAAGYKMGRA